MTAEQVQAAAVAASFSQMPDKLAAIIYLLNTNNMTAEAIQAAATPFSFMPDKWAAILYLLANGAAGGGGAQLVTYTAGSPANPPDVTKSAIAYDPNGILPTLGWRVSDGTWN